MKIAFVVHDYDRHGGHSRYVYELATRFARSHEVHVFANRVQAERDPKIQFHHVPAWRRNALTTVLTFILPATLLVRGFDVVHAQGLCGLRQDVITAHMCLDRWFEEQERFEGSLSWKQRLFKALVVPLERRMYALARSREAIAVSSAVARDLAARYGRSARVSVIPHGVDLETFNPRNRDTLRRAAREELGAREGDVLALYVGDLQKGATAAIRTAARVPGARLALVSWTPSARYAALARDMGVLDRVSFVPGTEHVERFYAAADIFLYPTIYDTFGMVIAEAMAAALPVITTATAGAAEIIESGAEGIVVASAREDTELASALDALARDGPRRARLGEAARRRIEGSSWDDVARRTLEVYERACGG